jgi:tRNA A37 threonylcarbamoyltransferase TsaD
VRAGRIHVVSHRKKLCSDNAAMIEILAGRKLLGKVPLPPLDDEIKPGWVLAQARPVGT